MAIVVTRTIGILFVASLFSALAQQATVNRSVVLHRDPSSRSKTLEHLNQGDRLTLVDATADSSFYHVRTENDVTGWVSGKYITISNVPLPPPDGTGPDHCDATLWNHVYHPQRLIVKQQCISVTGTIVDATGGREPDGVRHERDGDTHG